MNEDDERGEVTELLEACLQELPFLLLFCCRETFLCRLVLVKMASVFMVHVNAIRSSLPEVADNEVSLLIRIALAVWRIIGC